MEDFFKILNSEREKAVIGLEKVKEVLKMNAVKMILVSEDFEDNDLQELEKLVEEYGTEMKMISVDTMEGMQLKKIGGVVAILKFKIYI